MWAEGRQVERAPEDGAVGVGGWSMWKNERRVLVEGKGKKGIKREYRRRKKERTKEGSDKRQDGRKKASD